MDIWVIFHLMGSTLIVGAIILYMKDKREKHAVRKKERGK